MPALFQAAEQMSPNVGRGIGAAPAAAILAIAALAAAQPLDADLWVHLNNGRYIATSGALPYPDPFAFSAGDAVWTVHEWLSALAIFQVVSQLGVGAAVLASAAVYALTWGLLERVLAAHGVAPWMRVVALVAASLPLFPFAGIRPLAVGLLAAAVTASLALHHRRTGSRVVWLLPLVFVFWGNVHASFPIGYALLGALFLEALWTRAPLPFVGPRPRTRLGTFTVVSVLSTVAPALNPSGPRVLAQPFFLWDSEFRRFVSDWRPPEAFGETWWFFAIFLASIAVLLLVRYRRVTLVDLALLAVLLAAGYSTRKVMPFAAVLAPLLLVQPLTLLAPSRHSQPFPHSRPLPHSRESGNPSPPLRTGRWLLAAGHYPPRLRPPDWAVPAAAALVIAAAIGVAVAVSPRTLSGPTVVPMPAAARDLVAQTGATRIFSTYHWGAYLTWALWPDALVFIDGRFDLFVPNALDDYLTVIGLGPKWRQTITEIDPEALVIETDSPLARRLARPDSEWRDIGGDATARVFLRAPTGPT